MPAFIVPAAMALASGIANMISGSARAREEARKRDAANKLLERSIIDDAELGRLLRGQTRMFNAQLQNTINTTAIRSAGIANRGVVGAAAAGQIKAAEGVALASTEQAVEDRNAQIRTRQAIITQRAETFTDPVGDFTSGAVAGGIAGSQFSRTLGLLNKLDDEDPGVQNPFEGDSSVGGEGFNRPDFSPSSGGFELSTTPQEPQRFTGYNPFNQPGQGFGSPSNQPNAWLRRR